MRSQRPCGEVGGVVVVGGSTGGRRFFAGVGPAEDGDGRARLLEELHTKKSTWGQGPALGCSEQTGRTGEREGDEVDRNRQKTMAERRTPASNGDNPGARFREQTEGNGGGS